MVFILSIYLSTFILFYVDLVFFLQAGILLRQRCHSYLLCRASSAWGKIYLFPLALVVKGVQEYGFSVTFPHLDPALKQNIGYDHDGLKSQKRINLVLFDLYCGPIWFGVD